MGPFLTFSAGWSDISAGMNDRLEASGSPSTGNPMAEDAGSPSTVEGTRSERSGVHLFRQTRMTIAVPCLIGLAFAGVLASAVIGHLTGPGDPSTLAYLLWQDPLPPSSAPWAAALAFVALFFWGVAWYAWKARLEVDDQGFYLWRLRGSVEADWDSVTDIERVPSRRPGREPQ
jgi:hypothetical protein